MSYRTGNDGCHECWYTYVWRSLKARTFRWRLKWRAKLSSSVSMQSSALFQWYVATSSVSATTASTTVDRCSLFRSIPPAASAISSTLPAQRSYVFSLSICQSMPDCRCSAPSIFCLFWKPLRCASFGTCCLVVRAGNPKSLTLRT